MNDPSPGNKVDGRYTLSRVIARGGSGIVYQAQNRYSERKVALKLLAPRHVRREELRNRMVREAHALGAVKHPGFVDLLDAGICAEFGPYLVMEMLEGRTLDGILAVRRRLPEDDVVRIGAAMLEALAFAHERGVIHRDIKPSNVFVARGHKGEVVKLIDLGIAAVNNEAELGGDEKITLVNELLGTPEYMSPEQLYGQEVDKKTDIWATGMTLFECLTGELPYVGTYPEVLVRVATADRRPSVRALRVDTGQNLSLAIEIALSKDPKDRYPDATTFAEELRKSHPPPPTPLQLLAGLRSLPPQVAPSAMPGPKSEPSHRRQKERAPYVTPVQLFEPDGTFWDGRSEDISENGILVLVSAQYEDAKRILVRFAMPLTGEIVSVPGIVRWTKAAPRDRKVLGVEFDDPSDSVRKTLSDYAKP